MQYHMPHEVEKKKKEEIFTPLDELTLSQHSKLGHRCDACKLGHIHPPLETSGQKIERPRSALSPNTVKPAEIWTPQKAFAVAEELSLSMLRKKAIYQKCTCFIKNSKRYEGNDKLAMHCKTCPMRNLIRFNKKKKKTLRSLNTLNLSYHDHQSSTFDEVKMASP